MMLMLAGSAGTPPHPGTSDSFPFPQLFVGNFDYEAQSRDVERLIDRYGDVERIDMKMGARARCLATCRWHGMHGRVAPT